MSPMGQIERKSIGLGSSGSAFRMSLTLAQLEITAACALPPEIRAEKLRTKKIRPDLGRVRLLEAIRQIDPELARRIEEVIQP